MRRRWLLAAILLAAAARADAAIVTQWTFEGDVTTPSTGSGTATALGTTTTFATGNGGGRGWNTTNYPAQSTASGTEGVVFLASTAGFEDITVSYDHRASGTASRWAQLEYTTNGGADWTVFGNNGGGLSPHDTFYSFDFDLSSIAGVNDAAGFGFRILSIFSPVAFDTQDTVAANREIFGADAGYHRARADGGTGGRYGAGGTWRFDNVTIDATAIQPAAVPEPSSVALLGLVGGAGLLARRFRRTKAAAA